MRVGALVQPQTPGAVEFAQRAEALGVSSLWSPETWGYDALTGLAWIAAHTRTLEVGTFVVQLGSRSPALLASSALSLQALSDGRFRLGIGVSGPGVMEGWHGVRFDKPVQTTRETIEIVRMVSRGEKLEHPGEVYPLPLPDSRGKAITPALDPAEVPIYIAAMGPSNLALTGELADGWLGNAFVPEQAEVFLTPIAEGAARAGRTLDDLDLVAPVALEIATDPADAARRGRRHADGYAFTIGAMGSGSTNFYNDAFSRLGFGAEVAEVARLWKERRRDEAAAAVPLELGTRTNLVGTREQIAERVTQYQKAGISTLLAKTSGSWDEQLSALQVLVETVEQS
ncbi:MAG TPA: LLM class flavin-dependent oxidoreductase [Sporichthya sp.]|nr:LLM class flavin-dependent oxidoreductase [Sporichthya sp.]